jgi:hypothetical protein
MVRFPQKTKTPLEKVEKIARWQYRDSSIHSHYQLGYNKNHIVTRTILICEGCGTTTTTTTTTTTKSTRISGYNTKIFSQRGVLKKNIQLKS